MLLGVLKEELSVLECSVLLGVRKDGLRCP
jgi:hypothetical protein